MGRTMRQRYLAGIALLSLYAILFCASGAVNNSSIFLDAANISDSGFRPDVDGFGFENYGEHPDTVDLTAIEMQRMFGGQVCASEAAGQCILTYPAERWMNQAISAMKSGHCEGIAVLSGLMYYNQTDPGLFEGDRTINLSLQNSRLQREIGYWWTTQVTSPGGARKVLESPRAVLETLAAAFAGGRKADEWWVMGIYLPDGSGGHAITPFAVEESGNGTARIFVYDNNWPKESRYVEVDLVNNSWSYLASSNPDEPDSLYTGNASTRNLEIVTLSSRLGVQQCDFCNSEGSSPGSNATKNMQIWQSGEARALAVDESGRRAGMLDSGQVVNEIPGAMVRNLKFAAGTGRSPVILIPLSQIEGGHLAVQINSTYSGSGVNPADTAIIAPGFALTAQVSDLKAGQRQGMDLFSNGQGFNVSLSSGSSISPSITIETDLQRLSLSGLNLDPAGMINLSTDPLLGTMDMSTLGNAKPGTVKLLLTTLDPESGTESTYRSLDLMLRTDDRLSMDMAGLSTGAASPSLSISRMNGGTQEMSMTAVSRDVPVSMPEIEMTAMNLTPSNASGSAPTSVPSVSAPGTTGMSGLPEMDTAAPAGSEMPGTGGMGTPTFP